MNEEASKYELEHIESEIKELKSVFDIINKQTVAIEKLAVEMKFMREDHIKLDNRLRALEDKPVKRYEGIITQIISLIVAAVVGFILAMLGFK